MNIKHAIYSIAKKSYMLMQSEKLKPIPTPINHQKMLEDKVVLITGGSSGVGYAIAKACIDNGAYVIIGGRNVNKLQKCCLYSDKMKYIEIDIKCISTFRNKINEAQKFFPCCRIDILVNSAGVSGKNGFWDITEEEYDDVLDTNLKGVFFMSKAVAEYMRNNNIKGHILNISSSSSLRPAWNPYCISKWGISGLTKGLADILLPYDIIVNAIAPGPVATPMLGKKSNGDDNISLPNVISKRFAMPEEVANLAIYMISSMGDLIVGDTFYVSGGSGVITLHK